MDFEHYQEIAWQTDQFADKREDENLMIPLLGLAGETGTLLSEFKKKIRDKESYSGFTKRAEEELGDVLWYLSNIATRLNLSLSEIASKNLYKTQERWPVAGHALGLFDYFDSDFPESEQFPRKFRVKISESEPGKRVITELVPEGSPLGDALTDNAYSDDGYRFHDVFHLANVAVLGWSPVTRRLMGKKRKTMPKIDEVEDGARANIMEELIVLFIYLNAKERHFYENVLHVETEMLATIKNFVSHLEVGIRKTKEWEQAILAGYAAFRHLLLKKEGIFEIDMDRKELSSLLKKSVL